MSEEDRRGEGKNFNDEHTASKIGVISLVLLYKIEFCYGVFNQCELFICLDIMVKNMEVLIERYFKWWVSTKLV
jgi:hypothetical protein